MSSGQGRRVRGVWAALVLGAVLLLPVVGQARSIGIASTEFGLGGCPLCHFGGSAPSVLLSGPTTVTPGDTYVYTLTIWGSAVQAHGGLNVSAPAGVLATGGPWADNTRTITGAGGRVEITHSTPKQGDFSNAIDFSFQWTAPPAFTSVTIAAWGNGVDLNGTPSGDNASVSTLQVFANTAPTPSDTPSPTPTPIPCAAAAPLDPALLSDAAQQRCQAAVAKAGFLYVKQHVAAAQVCLKSFLRSGSSGDPLAACAGSAALPPTDAVAAGKLGKVEAKVRALLSGKCTSDEVAALDLCAATENALEDCFLQAHRQRAVDSIAARFGGLAPITDKGVAKCQGAVAAVSAKLVSAYQHASQKCLNLRNTSGAPAFGAAALCIGSVAAALPQPPTDPKTAATVGTALAALNDKINGTCSDAQVAALGACGTTRASLIKCLTCSQVSTVLGLISDEYGGN